MSSPTIVSHRNHFRSAGELVDDALASLPVEYHSEKFKVWLLRYTENVLRSVASNFATSAQRGIEQAVTLLCDPDFYAKRKLRRERQDRRLAHASALEAFDRQQQRDNPTEEQIESQIAYREKLKAYHQQRAEAEEIELVRLRRLVPNVITSTPHAVQ